MAAITAEGHAANATTPAPPQQTPRKPIRANPKGFSKRKGSTSGGIATTTSPEPKRTISVSTQQASPTATPLTSPLKTKTLPTTSPQAFPKDKLLRASKKR